MLTCFAELNGPGRRYASELSNHQSNIESAVVNDCQDMTTINALHSSLAWSFFIRVMTDYLGVRGPQMGCGWDVVHSEKVHRYLWGRVQCLRWLWLPGQHGPTPGASPGTPQIPSSFVNIKAHPPRFKVACQQSATSSNQAHLHFRSLLLPIAHCIAARCMSNIMHFLPRISNSCT